MGDRGSMTTDESGTINGRKPEDDEFVNLTVRLTPMQAQRLKRLMADPDQIPLCLTFNTRWRSVHKVPIQSLELESRGGPVCGGVIR